MPQERRHHPPESRYKRYRACLRWDFGFTCPFCMIHEGDISVDGEKRRKAVGIEHFQRRESRPELADIYENCLLSCTLCNEDRGTHPNTDQHGRNLLDPSKAAWAEHFVWQSDGKLRPKPGDGDAEYTFVAYKLDQPKKQGRHIWRRRLISLSLQVMNEYTKRISKLNEAARGAQRAGNFGKARDKLREAHQLRQHLATVAEQLQQYRAVPMDCPTRCRCGDGTDMTLPVWLARQTRAVTLPDVGRE